jgi:hypothetical protein
MKRFGLLALVVLLTAVAGYSQSNTSVAVVTGYTMSAFEDQEDAAGTLPVGVQLGYKASPNLQVGVGFTTLLGGLTWEATDMDYKVTTTFNQSIISAYAKYFLGEGQIKPFIKGGVGYFMGNADVEVEYAGEKAKDTAKIDPAIGFIVGGGLTLNKNIFAEFNYNLVSRKAADSGDEFDSSSNDSMGMNTWSVLIGYQINL